MGIALEGIQGTITSIAGTPGTTDLATMITTAGANAAAIPHNVSIQMVSETGVITSQGDTAVRNRAMLKSWTGTINLRYPRTTRTLGNNGTLTWASGGYSAYVQDYSLNVQAAALDYTSMTQSDKTFRYFRPSLLVGFSGTFNALFDAAVTLPGTESPATAPSSYAALTLKLIEDGANDPTLSGNAFISQIGHTMNMGTSELQRLAFSFMGDGALTATPGTNFAALWPPNAGGSPTAIGQPTWDINGDGTPDQTIVVTAASGRTFTGDCFWTSVAVNVPMTGLIDVTVGIQGTGPYTLA
jgi:hypothetical protein